MLTSQHMLNSGLIGTLDLPGIAVGHPVVRFFFLVPTINGLPEQAILIVDAVPVSRYTHGGQRVQKTGRQATETAISQRGFRFAFQHVIEIDAHRTERLPARIEYSQITQVISQGLAQEEFHGEIMQTLGINLLISVLSVQHPVDKGVSNSERYGHKQLATGTALPFFS